MGATYALIGCLAWIGGLLLTAIAHGGWIALGMGVIAMFVIPRYWRSPLHPRIWLIAGLIALIATGYFQARSPRPSATDISHVLTAQHRSLNVVVTGTVDSLPRMTRSGKAQIWLQAQAIAPVGDGKPITGIVYTTLPAEQATDLHPGDTVAIGGSLYLPQAAANPGGFDFQHYLEQEGSFSGLRGEQVTQRQAAPGWGWWQVQQRIIQAQQAGAGTPAGALISAMVLGGRVVDLPYAVKDAFVRVGLAHALAASGFQISLILGVVLGLTRRLSPRLQAIAGAGAIALFVSLAGFQPAVLRAAVMGWGSLVALALDQRVKPLGALLVTAVILLLIKPLWIWDLGFQLSFLATLGLLVTVPVLSRRLDWLPPAIAAAVAVPLAAYLWTLPLQLGAFGVLSPYSIPINVITTPFVAFLSLLGMASAVAAVMWQPLGEWLAWLAQFPANGLIAIVQWGNGLPGNGWALGTIPVAVVLGLYLLLGLTSWQRWWQVRWRWALGAGVGLVMLTVGLGWFSPQATLLATQPPVLIVRDRGRVLAIGSVTDSTLQSTLKPYFQRAGINQIDWAIAPDPAAAASWQTLATEFPVAYLVQPPILTASAIATALPTTPTPISVDPQTTAQMGPLQLQWVSVDPAIAHFTLHHQTWLWLDTNAASPKAAAIRPPLPPAQVLWWSGQSLDPAIAQQVQPQTAIANSAKLSPATADYFQQHPLPLYLTGRDGAVQWTPQQGFTLTQPTFGAGMD